MFDSIDNNRESMNSTKLKLRGYIKKLSLNAVKWYIHIFKWLSLILGLVGWLVYFYVKYGEKLESDKLPTLWKLPYFKIADDILGPEVSTLLLVIGLLIACIKTLFGLLEKAIIQTDNVAFYARAGSVFSPLGVHSGIYTEPGSRFDLAASPPYYHITVHSEVLYYSMVCSLLESWKGQIKELYRSHVFLPHSPSSLFLQVIRELTSSVKKQHVYYIFDNDILDYDRNSMKGKGQKDKLCLWSTFVKASCVLLHENRAYYGYMRPRHGTPDIWGTSTDRARFREHQKSCDRLMFEVKNGKAAFSGVVERNPDTLAFVRASISIGGDDASIARTFFGYLQERTNTSALFPVGDWDEYPIEVALISGEEMESKSERDIEFWAVDDFAGGWMEHGTPRQLVWLKTMIAAERGAFIKRLFLIEPSLLSTTLSASDEEKNNFVDLFATVALQHLFLSPPRTLLLDRSKLGEVKVLCKNESFKVNGVYPDYQFLVRKKNMEVLGGVALQPKAKYVDAGDKRWLIHLQDLWNNKYKAQNIDQLKARDFPNCFTDADHQLISEQFDKIVERVVKDRDEFKNISDFPNKLKTWLTAQFYP